MSRIGKTPIQLPENVTVTVKDDHVTVKGPKGELSMSVTPGVVIEQNEGENGTELALRIEGDGLAAIWGTTRSLLENMVVGVTDGWSKSLELHGVGFRMEVQGSKLKLRLGYSHDIEYDLPEGIEASIEKDTLTIAGIDRQKVGQVASEIRAFKKPEPYKGKGFRYSDEVIIRKAGKTAAGE